jgi:serine O-acetyltransferase
MWEIPDKQCLRGELLGHLTHAAKTDDVQQLGPALQGAIERATELVFEDLMAYSLRDPASKGKAGLIFAAYASFKAVLCYRLAREVWQLDGTLGKVRELIAHKLSNHGKLLSGIEIHPGAKIGRRFVLDHGFGTVIGETCEFGDDCYILSGVILGATGIAGNATGKRHPRLGSRVEVGSGARILGPVVIGDDVFISPSCIITQDVPAGVKVLVVNQVQVQKKAIGASYGGFLSAFALGQRLHLVGELADPGEVFILDADHQRLTCIAMECTACDVNHMQYRMRRIGTPPAMPRFPLNVRIVSPKQDLTVFNPAGLSTLVRSLLQSASATLPSPRQIGPTMQTQALFDEAPYERAFDARVIAVSEQGVAFDRTLFYPTGGGQPGDTGHLTLADGTRIAVLGAQRDAMERALIWHQIDADSAGRIQSGVILQGDIDWARRYAHMRMHTCLHLLCSVLDAPVTGCGIGHKKGRLDFDIPEMLLDKAMITHALNGLIRSGREVKTQVMEAADYAAALTSKRMASVAPSVMQGMVRVIGIPGIDRQPCGGTHVRSVEEIGEVVCDKIEKKSQRNRRVTIRFVQEPAAHPPS